MVRGKTKKRVVQVSVLPSEPLDGSGKVCIHLFVRDEGGPFTEPYVLHENKAALDEGRKEVVARPTRGRLACDPKRMVEPVTRNGVITITMRTDSPQAVTCPKCIASPFYKSMTEEAT